MPTRGVAGGGFQITGARLRYVCCLSRQYHNSYKLTLPDQGQVTQQQSVKPFRFDVKIFSLSGLAWRPEIIRPALGGSDFTLRPCLLLRKENLK